MRLTSFLSLLLFCLHFGGIIAAPAVEFERREVDTIARLAIRDEPDATTTADSTSSETPTATTDTQSATATTSSTNTSASSTSGSTPTSTSTPTTVPSLDGSSTSGSASQNGTKSTYAGGLPIKPAITPAIGVAGAVLLILGAALALIGIRKPRVYIFLSTALLAALGVTVLIEYVMSPPVSNAVQGGYLVAVFFTGVIFGGLALIFHEITEGLCCLLGGFCIGMWFLTLKNGGLVTEQGAKIGFIIAFTLGFYCLSFSHHTRTYGSIGCTSFAGATTLVLGIDCFSRAGLKEFWLYIWGLNDDMFPLNTDTYPVTRNIRVEIAIIIIIAVFGVIAQMRLWRIIKERRAKEEEARLEAQRQKDEAEAEIGRQLEEKNLKERAEWEHMYGNGHDGKEPSMTETAVAEDSRRGSDGFGSSTRENGNSFEMKDMASPDQSVPVSDCGKTLDAVDEVESDSVFEGKHGPSQDAHEPVSSPVDQHQRNEKTPRSVTPVSHKKSAPEINVHEDNDSEHGAVVGSEVGSLRSRRFSGTSFANRLSWRSGLSRKNSQSEEALVAVDDATSSVAGIVDDLQSVSSRYPSVASDHKEEVYNPHDPEVGSKNMPNQNEVPKVTETELDPEETSDDEPMADQADVAVYEQDEKRHVTSPAARESAEIHQSNTIEQPSAAQAQKNISQPKEPATPPDSPVSNLEENPVDSTVTNFKNEEANLTTPNSGKEHSPAAGIPSEAGQESPNPQSQHAETVHDKDTAPESKTTEKKAKEKARLDVSTVQDIPEQTSRVIHSFRTREWAKHLADAERPDLEPLDFDNEPEEDLTDNEELAAPIDVDGLLQTALNAQPPPVMNQPQAMEPRRSSSDKNRRQSRMSAAPSPEMPRSKTRHSTQNTLGIQSPALNSRNASSPSLHPPESEDPVAPMRSTSTPQLTITPPGETKPTKESHRWSGPPPLLAVRENMMRNRMSSTSLRYDPWAGRNQSRQSVASPDPILSPPLSIPDEKDEDDELSHQDEDEIPLSKRRAMLQRQSMQSPSSSSVYSSEPARSPQYTTAEVDRSESRMAAWRQSVRDDLSQRRDPLGLHSPPTSPDRPRSLWGSVQQMRDASSAQVGNAIADGMQRGSMTDLHRQAMRKMQASANRKL